MIHPGEGDTSTVRSVFIIDPENKVRLTLTYPKSVGRNFDEILRVIDALQLTDANPVSTPADWTPGQRVVVSPASRPRTRRRSSRTSRRSSPTCDSPSSRKASPAHLCSRCRQVPAALHCGAAQLRAIIER